MAKRAGERAAHLAANAQSAAIFFGNINDLYLMPASYAHQIFARAIAGDLSRDHFGHLKHEGFGEFGAIVF